MKDHCSQCGRELSEGSDGRAGGCIDCGGGAAAPPEGVLLSVDIRFRCPLCAKKLAVEAHHEGARASCPRCHKVIRIPRPVRGPGAGGEVPANLLTESELKVLLTAVPEGI